MADELKKLTDYPEVSFIGDYDIDSWETMVIDWYQEKYKEVTGNSVQLPSADWRRLILEGIAYYTFLGMKQIEFNGRMNLLKYAVGGYLDNLGAMKHVSRQTAAGAVTTLRYSMTAERSSATGIPAGSRVTAGDGVYFATDEYAEIPAGSLYIDVNATCLTTGRDGNIYSVGELDTMVDIVTYIDAVQNTTIPANGRDGENDDDFRERIFLAPDGFTTGGTKGAYEYMVRLFDSTVQDVKATSPTPGEVHIIALLEGGVIPDEQYLASLDAFVTDPARRMLTDQVDVAAPDVENYNIDLTYYINNSDKNKASAIQSKVNAALSDFTLWQRGKIGRDINPDELIARIKNAGAKRVVVRSPVYSALGDSKVAIPGTVTAVYGGLEDD